MFSWQSKREHAGVGRNTTLVELARRNLAELHCKFFRQYRNKKTSSTVKKYYQLVFVKEFRNVG